jgi:hypothetical protein
MFKYCLILCSLSFVHLMNVTHDYELDYGNDTDIYYDYYDDADYINWQPFPGNLFYAYFIGSLVVLYVDFIDLIKIDGFI